MSKSIAISPNMRERQFWKQILIIDQKAIGRQPFIQIPQSLHNCIGVSLHNRFIMPISLPNSKALQAAIATNLTGW